MALRLPNSSTALGAAVSLQSLNVSNNNDDDAISPSVFPTEVNIIMPNISLQHGCVEVRFSDMESPRWEDGDDAYDMVSAEVELVALKVKNCLLALLALVGGAGNVINMAVFWKHGLKDRVNLCLFALALADELHILTTLVYNGEQIYAQFVTGERIGPARAFLTDHHFVGLMGFGFVSAVLSAVVACERCLCVLRPLSYQTAMRTRTMAAVITAVYALVVGSYFVLLGFRFRSGCLYDVASGAEVRTIFLGRFYQAHKPVLDILNSVVFGVGLPVLVVVVVAVTTMVTAVKLRQILTWRVGVSVSLSVQEVALTKMLMATSILFVTCVLPTAVIRNVSLIFPEMDIGGRHENLFKTFLWISQCFTFVNCSANIFVYYRMGSRYRTTFWALFGRKEDPKS